MDIFDDIWKIINNFLFSDKDEVTVTEQTSASFNVHTVNFDITAKTLEEIPLVEIITPNQNNVKPTSVSLQTVLDFLGITERSTNKAHLADINQTRTANVDIPGKTFVKVTEDLTGETIEVFQLNTDMPTTVKNVTDDILDLLNGTTTKMIQKQHSRDESDNTNIYIIVALVMVLVITFSVLGIVWCKKNRLKAEKRNLYPVITVVNSEYMNPQALKNNEKLKEMP